MCTAIAFTSKDFYFGRNLDLEYSYEEQVTITPRNFPFSFRLVEDLPTHYAMIGMAYVAQGYPLYYDATNEFGLSMAGLNFPQNAVYHAPAEGKDNLAPFELIPWLLGTCRDLSQARKKLARLQVADLSFSQDLPASPLHWMLSDATGSLTIESVAQGLRIYENPVGVLTNNPPFDYQMTNLSNYQSLSVEAPQNRLAPQLPLGCYSRGMGAMGLPGDLSSASRFVRAAFTKLNSRCDGSERQSVSQFFHILGSVAQQRGCVHLGGERYEETIYSACCNASRGIYYYKTYENSQITAVDLWQEDVDGRTLAAYPLRQGQHIVLQNAKGGAQVQVL